MLEWLRRLRTAWVYCGIRLLNYSGVLKEVTGPVSLPGAQESQRADVCNAQEPLHRGEAMRITQHARKSIGNKAPEQMRREDTRILGKRRGTPPSSTGPSFSPAESQQPSQAAFSVNATWTRQCWLVPWDALERHSMPAWMVWNLLRHQILQGTYVDQGRF
jgi:hypothetical protein